LKRNPNSPWNPGSPVALTPKELEHRVGRWIRSSLARDGIQNVTIEPQGVVTGDGGDYKIDSLVRITFLRGAELVLLAECKHQKRPVERDELLILEAKLTDVGAHKGILFSTAGFQSGALTYAEAKGIGTVTVADGKFTYDTRAFGDAEPPNCLQLPDLVGIILKYDEGKSSITSISFEDDDLDELGNFLTSLLGMAGRG
jgi:restriction system protein